MARICLISPGHLSSNPRLVKEADALTEEGHEVVVISGWSFPPLQQDDRYFLKRSWSKQQRVPFGALAGPYKRTWQRLRQKLAIRLAKLEVGGLYVAIRAWHPAGSELIKATCNVVADLYIAHYPAALPAAALAANIHGSCYAFDAEDFHLGDFPESINFDWQRQLLKKLELFYLPGCTFITAASPGIAEAYRATYSLPLPVVVRNVFPLSRAPTRATPKGSAVPGPSLYWFSQTIGPDRGLESAVRALALTESKPHLYLRGFVSAEYRYYLESLAQSVNVFDRLHLLLPAPADQMEELAAIYDLGLVAETGLTPNRRIALTNKLFTYALAGLPMLLSDIPAHCSIQAEAEGAVRLFRCDDPVSLATALDAWLAVPPAVLAEARVIAYRLGQEKWNWERERQAFLRKVSEVFV